MTELITRESEYLTLAPPHEVVIMIREIIDAICQNKQKLESIQNRSLFQRAFNNNTRDLAQAMIAQGDTISGFLELIKGVVFCQIGNLSSLMKLRDGLHLQRNDIDEAGKAYIDLATSFLDQALVASKMYDDRFEIVDSTLSEVQRVIVDNRRLEEDQNKSIQYLIGQLKDYTKTVDGLNSSILSLQRQLTQKDRIDDEQDRLIKTIQLHLEKTTKLDSIQNDRLHCLEKGVGALSYDNKESARRFDRIEHNAEEILSEFHRHKDYQEDIQKHMGTRLKSSSLLLLVILILTILNSSGLLFLLLRL